MSMSDRTRPSRPAARRWLVSLALILPLLLATLFPAGLMPTQDQNGQTVMVLCSGNGPMLMVIDPITGTYHQAPATRSGSACDWAAAHTVSDFAAPITLAAQPIAAQRTGRTFTVTLWRRAYDPLGIWARGPPSSV